MLYNGGVLSGRFLLYNEVALPLVRRQVSSVVVEGGAGTGDGEDRPPANHEEPKALEQATVEPKALKSDDPEDVARLTIEVRLPRPPTPVPCDLPFPPDHECI